MKCSLFAADNEAVDREYDSLIWKKTNDAALWEQDQAQERMRSADELWAIDPTKAFQQFRDLAAQGSVWSMNIVGHAYTRGRGVQVDLAQAEKWYRRAFEAGSDRALLGLTGIYKVITHPLRIGRVADSRFG